MAVDGYFTGGVLTKEPYKYLFKYEIINGVSREVEAKFYCWNEKKKELHLSREKVNDYHIGFGPRDFTLTAFGLQEPDWYQPPRPWWLFSSLIGMGLLALGAIVLRYGKALWNRS